MCIAIKMHACVCTLVNYFECRIMQLAAAHSSYIHIIECAMHTSRLTIHTD